MGAIVEAPQLLSDAEVGQLRLPEAPHPRPGEHIIWHQNARSYRGRLIGHRYDGRPIVLHEDGLNSDDLQSFDQLRALDPFAKQLPNWRRLPEAGQIFRLADAQSEVLDELLTATFPSGASYYQVANEIWARGYEIFLVGGTVRDVLAGLKPNDIDFITTMPLKKLIDVVEAVCRYSRKDVTKFALRHGHLRLGGKPGSADRFADISVFKFRGAGAMNTVFGADFARDMGQRDFSCNSTYYDPINKTLIDPSGCGVIDTTNKLLRPVFEVTTRAGDEVAKIFIRTFKFTRRGYTIDGPYATHITNNYAAILQSLRDFERIRYVRTQVLSKYPRERHRELISAYKEEFLRFGLGPAWDKFFEPFLTQIVGDK